MTNLEKALLWAKAGIKIFPCNGKTPHTNSGFKDASSDLEQVKIWWNQWPDANIGLPCAANGILVIDADRHEKDVDGVKYIDGLFQKFNLNKNNYCCVTTAGNGEHYYFSIKDVNAEFKGQMADGVDIKYNGYVIAPGSKDYNLKTGDLHSLAQAIDKNRLRGLPSEFRKIITKSSNTLIEKSSCNTGIKSDSPGILKQQFDNLSKTLSGNRNNSLNKSSYILGLEGIDKDQAFQTLKDACEINGLLEADGLEKFSNTFNSGFEKGRNNFTNIQSNKKIGAENYLSIKPLSEFEIKPIQWLWEPKLALGKITILAGDPGLGKSQVTMKIAAHVTKGEVWPDGKENHIIGNVLLLTCEDDVADTIKPRLIAAEANIDRISIIESVISKDSKHKSFNFSDDMGLLEKSLESNPDIKLLIIDPISAYMGRADSHKAADVRGVLAPLQDIAQKHGIAVLAISHLNKNGGNGRAINAVTGSGAFVAAARAFYLVAKDPNDPKNRFLCEVKNNLGRTKALSFKIAEKEVVEGIKAPYVVFDKNQYDICTDDLVGGNSSQQTTKKDIAINFLEDELSQGPVLEEVIEKNSQKIGVSPTTLKRAKKELGIKSSKDGYQGKWIWSLPD